MTVLERFFDRIAARGTEPILYEVRGDQLAPWSGADLRDRIAQIRGWLRERALQAGDRVAWVADNSAAWVALDLAVLAEGLVAVPWYPRQSSRELAQYAEDCDARLIVAGDERLAGLLRAATDRPVTLLADAVGPPVYAPPRPTVPVAPFTLVYTSGTTGTAKGAIVTEANVAAMLPITASALEAMMGSSAPDHRVFHYLPLCFLGSRVVLWTCLWRGNPIALSTQLDQLAQELATARPHYVLNVPLLLERMRARVEAGIAQRASPVRALWAGAHRAAAGSRRWRDRAALAIAGRSLFPAVRKKLGPELRCLLCGSAPLAPETQAWFAHLGLPVYQVYGLTETTAILTMDVPPDAVPGTVGRAIPGVQLRIGDDDELQAQGPNLFPGYWRRPADTAAAFSADGWFRTGDRASLDGGVLRILGRLKSVIVLTSGHKVSPEGVEEVFRAALPTADQVVAFGHQRKALLLVVSGPVSREAVADAVSKYNDDAAHYRRVAAFHLHPEVMNPEGGWITANGKLKRAALEAAFRPTLDALEQR